MVVGFDDPQSEVTLKIQNDLLVVRNSDWGGLVVIVWEKGMKNKVTAALLALFLGSLGVHKFYLGQNCAGVLYLLFSWTMFPTIIAFFEFLGLIFMSDRVFDSHFNQRLFPYQNSMIRESWKDRIATLEGLKRLYDKEIITAEEYEEKRRKILDSL